MSYKSYMSNQWCAPVVLEGRFIRLEPMSVGHAADLVEAVDDRMFDLFPGPYFPLEQTVEGLTEYIKARITHPATVPFVAIDLESNKAVASSSFFEIQPVHRTLEIGHTWIKEELRGKYVNPEMKLLMLEHAFEDLDAIRVQFRTDKRNVQSQNAILKLGAKFEGAFRNHMIMADGHFRESVFYSIIPEEWPKIKEALLHRLEG